MQIASLAAHTTLNTYNLWKLALRGHLNTDARTRDRTRNFLITRTLGSCFAQITLYQFLSSEHNVLSQHFSILYV